MNLINEKNSIIAEVAEKTTDIEIVDASGARIWLVRTHYRGCDGSINCDEFDCVPDTYFIHPITHTPIPVERAAECFGDWIESDTNAAGWKRIQAAISDEEIMGDIYYLLDREEREYDIPAQTEGTFVVGGETVKVRLYEWEKKCTHIEIWKDGEWMDGKDWKDAGCGIENAALGMILRGELAMEQLDQMISDHSGGEFAFHFGLSEKTVVTDSLSGEVVSVWYVSGCPVARLNTGVYCSYHGFATGKYEDGESRAFRGARRVLQASKNNEGGAFSTKISPEEGQRLNWKWAYEAMWDQRKYFPVYCVSATSGNVETEYTDDMKDMDEFQGVIASYYAEDMEGKDLSFDEFCEQNGVEFSEIGLCCRCRDKIAEPESSFCDECGKKTENG